ASGNFTAGTITANLVGDITGNAATVTSLSGHNVTELDDVTSAGSGEIITSTERTNLNNNTDLLNVTPGTVTASKAVVVDGNKDINGFRNLQADGAITSGSSIVIDGTGSSYGLITESHGKISFDDETLVTMGSIGIGNDTPGYELDVTGDVGVSGNMYMVATTATEGIIYQGGSTFLHAYGSGNTFTGAGSGNLSLTGADNTGMGYMSLNSLTEGSDNTAVGEEAMYNTTTGGGNTALGYYALINNTSGWENTAVGFSALGDGVAELTGDGNTAIGVNSMMYTTSGSYNTALGWASGSSIESGSYNITIGYMADVLDADDDYQMNIGDIIFANGESSFENVGIGNSFPSATLDLVGTFKYVDGNEGAGKVLTSDANGNATWQTPSGSTSCTYGEMYITDGTSTFGGTANTWYKVTGLTGGYANGVSYASDALTVGTAGKYEIIITSSFEGSTGDTFEAAIGINGTVNTTHKFKRKTSSNDVGSATFHGVYDLSASDAVTYYVRNVTDGSSMTVVDLNITVKKL
ncbi:MAG: hypothetical protein JW861_00020, partial [Bacteroidales bacterium]|nr:hypothetical protein [Bacteroidales bacterium]